MDGLRLDMSIHSYCSSYGLATISLQVQDLLNYTIIDPMVQRKLSASQRRKISNYLQERELDHVFFGPVTLSLREVGELSKENSTLYLKHGSKLSVIDGQHRLLALSHVNEQMLKEVRRIEKKLASLKIKQRKEPDSAEMAEELERLDGLREQLEERRLALMETELSVQMYIGLNEEEEKQLFGDINSKIQLVSKELGHSFDSTDPLNVLIQQVVEHNLFLKSAGVEQRGSLTSFNKNFTSFSWLYSVASMLFSGTMQPSYELMRTIRKDFATYVEIMHQFFDGLLPLMPEQPGLASNTSASRVMQESIALYAHSYLFDGGEYNLGWTSCLDIFETFDWTHDNEQLAATLGRLDNGKLNLIHEKSLRKHDKLVRLFRQMAGEAEEAVS
jgi:hypothetical protein